MDSYRVMLIVLISMTAGIPMFICLYLGGTGALGDFGESSAFEIIKYALIILTLVFYFIVSPFFLWPRILNRDSKSEDTE